MGRAVLDKTDQMIVGAKQWQRPHVLGQRIQELNGMLELAICGGQANSFDLPSYGNVDVRLDATLGAPQLYLFARNLLDDEHYINGVQYGPGIAAASLGRGRIAG